MIINTLKMLTTMLAIGLCVAMTSDANAVEPDQVNPKALQDLNAFLAKTFAADKLFGSKKYGEAASTFAAANSLYVRAIKRDGSAAQLTISFPINEFPSLRYYGYGMGENPAFHEDVKGKWSAEASAFNAAVTQMWQDAAILSGADKGPMGGTYNDEPSIVDLTQDQIDSMIRQIYGPASKFELPVGNDQWVSVMLQSRRAKLILEYALQKYPEWKTAQLPWSKNPKKYEVTGAEALAQMNANIKEAEPEYKKLVKDFQAAEPKFYADNKAAELKGLSEVLAGVKRDGYMGNMSFRSLFVDKDYSSETRKKYQEMWAVEGKTLPAGALKPLEDKAAAIKAAVAQNAPRFKFPAGHPHDALVESRTKSAIASHFPGAKILKTALDKDGWQVVKDTAQFILYRQRAVLVLMQRPSEKYAWLLWVTYQQDYSGGGTFNTSGKVNHSYIAVRAQQAA